MKALKKIMPLLLAVAMLFNVVPAAQAAGTGSITVNGTTAGKEYSIYKVFDLVMAGNDASAGVTYSIDSDWTAFFNGAGAEYLVDQQPSGQNLNQVTVNGATKYVNITENNVSAFANKAQTYAQTLTADSTQPAEGTSLTFSGLDLGYYLVFPKDAQVKQGNGSLVSLTSTTPNSTVNMKGDYPTIDKTVDDQDVEIGQTPKFTVTGTVPDTAGSATYTYQITDKMSEGLTFGTTVADTNFSIKFGNTAISATADGVKLAFAGNGYVLTFDMAKFQQYKGQGITIEYTATVNDKAVVNYTHNDVYLEYGHDPNDPDKTTPIDVPVWSSRIVVDKFKSGDESVKLAGAKFVLKNKDGKYYKYTAATATEKAKVEWVDTLAEATEVTTDDQGAATFNGLESGTYYLQETEAPTGYNLLTSDVEVTVTAPAKDSAGKEIGVSQTAKVENKSGQELPETGGIGTTIFYVVGTALLLGAGVTLFVRRRVNNQ